MPRSAPRPMRYDPLLAPDPEAWLALDEQDRIALALEFHERARIELPNVWLHAVFHAVVETQNALGSESRVAATLERLQGEGLDRHEAIHAVGAVLAPHMHHVIQTGKGEQLPEKYRVALDALTGDSWRRSGRPH
jgi:hypothetical protein